MILKTGQTIGKYTIVRELGQRVPHAFAAHTLGAGGEPELVVVEHLASSDAPASAIDAFARRARQLAQVRHPNISRIRDVILARDRCAVISDFSEGETFADLLALDAASGSPRMGLAECLRVLVDVLSGISSIHLAPELDGVDGGGLMPMHGAIHPKNVVIGIEGSARLIRLVRAPTAVVEEASYSAPELLFGDAKAGVGADLYAVGVMLWEALAGAPLFVERDPKEVLARQLAGPLPRAPLRADAEWAKGLVDVAARALEGDPEKRFLSPAELAGALRLAVQARLAPAARVGGIVDTLARTKIEARRAALRSTPRAARVPIAFASSSTTSSSTAVTPIRKLVLEDSRPKSALSPSKEALKQKALAALPNLRLRDDQHEDDDDDDGKDEVTRRLRLESLSEDDLWTGEEDEARKPSAPPLRAPSAPSPKPEVAVSRSASVSRSVQSAPKKLEFKPEPKTEPKGREVSVATAPAWKPTPENALSLPTSPAWKPEPAILARATPKEKREVPRKTESVATVPMAPISFPMPVAPAALPVEEIVVDLAEPIALAASAAPPFAIAAHAPESAKPFAIAPVAMPVPFPESAPSGPHLDENIGTIAPVVSPAFAVLAASTPSVSEMDELASASHQSAMKRRRTGLVLGVVGVGALILIFAGVKHASSSDASKTLATASATVSAPPKNPIVNPTATATAAIETATPIATTTETPAPPQTSIATTAAAETTATPPPQTGVAHDWATHPAVAPKPHKRPPHSNYEPEGI